MRSIKMKFWILILTCILLSAVLLLGVSSINTGAVLAEDSVEIMNLMCQKETQEMDVLLMNMENVVDILQRYVQEKLSAADGEHTLDEAHMEEAKQLVLNITEESKESTAVYIWLSPDFDVHKGGFCLIKKDGEGVFDENLPFPVMAEAESGEEELWFQTALDQGAGAWCLPHEGPGNGDRVISYVSPLYKDGSVAGIIGIDIDMDTIIEHVDSIQVYDTGYAFLGDKNKNIYYHKDFPDGLDEKHMHGNVRQVMSLLSKAEEEGEGIYEYNWNGEKKKMTFQTLRNGMLIALTVPAKEINAVRIKMLIQSIALLCLIVIIFMGAANSVTEKIVKPLKNLTQAAEKVAEGDLNVTIECNTRDEIKVLADSFEQTVHSLKRHMDYINKLAYTDSMTGALNKMAYKEAVLSIEKLMAEDKVEYAVAVMDINNLKKINDSFGHEFGDMLIRDSAAIMQRTFRKNDIYRIGGDEFVVILKNDEARKGIELLAIFNDEINRFNRNNTKYEQKVQIAIGLATYDKEIDKMYRMVFSRADAAMYENKMKLKEAEKKLKEQKIAEEPDGNGSSPQKPAEEPQGGI